MRTLVYIVIALAVLAGGAMLARWARRRGMLPGSAAAPERVGAAIDAPTPEKQLGEQIAASDAIVPKSRVIELPPITITGRVE